LNKAFCVSNIWEFYMMQFVRFDALILLLLSIFAGQLAWGAPPEATSIAAEVKDEVAELIEQLESLKTSECDAAVRRLLRIGPAARPQLERALATKKEDYVRRRIDIILRTWDARAK